MTDPELITIEPGKCGGKPCIRGMDMTVYNVSWGEFEAILEELGEHAIRQCKRFECGSGLLRSYRLER